jgi:hypothetical protein
MHKASVHFGDVPMMKWCKMREVWQFLYLKERYHHRFEQLWREVVKREAIEDGAEGLPLGQDGSVYAAADITPPPLTRRSAGHDTRPSAHAGDHGAGPAKPPPAPPAPPPNPPPTPKKRKFDEDTEKQLNSLRALKIRYNTVYASASDLSVCIESDDSWSWAKPVVDNMSGYVKELFAYRMKSQFWKEWCVADLTRIRKNFSQEEVSRELNEHQASLAKCISNLEMEISILKGNIRAGWQFWRLPRNLPMPSLKKRQRPQRRSL